MGPVPIRAAGRADAADLAAALRALSAEMGDAHLAGDDTLARAGFGPHPVFRALLAGPPGDPCGAIVMSPFLSTTRGGAGAYVSDLWVAPGARGAGLGRRLLRAARDEAAALWGARVLRIGLHRDNARAAALYHRLGFRAGPGEDYLTADAGAIAAWEGD